MSRIALKVEAWRWGWWLHTTALAILGSNTDRIAAIVAVGATVVCSHHPHLQASTFNAMRLISYRELEMESALVRIFKKTFGAGHPRSNRPGGGRGTRRSVQVTRMKKWIVLSVMGVGLLASIPIYRQMFPPKNRTWGTTLEVSENAYRTRQDGRGFSVELGIEDDSVQLPQCLIPITKRPTSISSRTNSETIFRFRADCLKKGCFLLKAGEIYMCRRELYQKELEDAGIHLESRSHK